MYTVSIVAIVRKKKTTAEDFKASFQNFRAESRSLKLASAGAGKKAGLAKTAVEGFQGCGRVYDEEIYTPVQIRWMKACHKVVVQNAVEKYRKMLEKMAESQDDVNNKKSLMGKYSRVAGRNTRASFPVDLRTVGDDSLPKIHGGSDGTHGHAGGGECKKVVKVMSKYSKAGIVMQSTSQSTLPQIKNKTTGRRKTFGSQ